MTDAAKARFHRTGHGRDLVVLLPPSAGPIGSAPFIEDLSNDFHALRYAQRGLDGGPPLDGALTMAQLGNDLNVLLESLDIESTHMVCHSTGCGIGLAFAAEHPAKVDDLVLINPWSWGDPHLTTLQNLRLAAIAGLDSEQYARFNAALLFPHDYRRMHHDGFDALVSTATAPNLDVWTARLSAILQFDARPLLGKLACRTLVLGANDDQLMPHWFATEIAEGIDDSTLHLYESGGHMLPETQRDDVVRRIRGFIS